MPIPYFGVIGWKFVGELDYLAGLYISLAVWLNYRFVGLRVKQTETEQWS
jgi:hypothetical protein